MKVITSYPVQVRRTPYASAGQFMSFDGKSASSAQVLAFQKFANSKGYSPKLVEDGKYGAKTEAAIKVWGAEFDKAAASLGATMANIATGGASAPTAQPSAAEIEKQKKAGKVWNAAKGVFEFAKEKGILDSVLGMFGMGSGSQSGSAASTEPIADTTTDGGKKPMSTTTKVLIGVGVVAVIGVVIYAVNKNKK